MKTTNEITSFNSNVRKELIHIINPKIHNNCKTLPLETQMGKPTLNGAQFFISTISGTMQLLALYASSSLGQKKIPLRVKIMEEIGRVGG
jgi:hypothetical protein